MGQPEFATNTRTSSLEGERNPHRKALFQECLLRTDANDGCGVRFVEEAGVEILIAVGDDVRIFRPRLTPVGTQHHARSHSILDACAILQSHMEDATAI